MIQRLAILLLLGSLLLCATGCALIWGTDSGHKFADSVAANTDKFPDGAVMDSRHGMKHLEVILRDFRAMHRFWDYYFMDYDWNDPAID